jgi:hypothetical protein
MPSASAIASAAQQPSSGIFHATGSAFRESVTGAGEHFALFHPRAPALNEKHQHDHK